MKFEVVLDFLHGPQRRTTEDERCEAIKNLIEGLLNANLQDCFPGHQDFVQVESVKELK